MNRFGRLVFLLVFILFLSACKVDVDNQVSIINIDPSENGTDILEFKLVSLDDEVCFPFQMNDTVIHICLDQSVNLHALIINVQHNGKYVKVDGKAYHGETLDFADYLNPHRLAIISSDGEITERVIQIYNLPVLCIETPDGCPLISKDVKIEGCKVTLYDGLGGAKYESLAEVEGRGNSTWVLPKKPYNIKLDKKYGFWGLPKSKQWILLANAFWDRTQMHNAVAYEMARLTDYPWVQSGRFVELILNGRHQGLYYLCEKIRVEKGRININVMDSTIIQKENMDGGYFIETAFSAEGNTFQTDYFNATDAGNPLFWEIKEPDKELLAPQAEYIKEELDHLESLLLNEDSVRAGKYRELLDIETAINWMLVNEVACNQETLNPSNLFLYRDKGGLIKFGPPWDFDAHTFGVYGENKVFLMRPTFYFYWMLKDQFFVNRLKEKWTDLKKIWVSEIPRFINTQYEQIYQSALRNERMWPDWQYLYQYPEKDYHTLISEMKSFLDAQVKYVDDVINSL